MQPIWQVWLNLVRGQGSGGADTTIAITVAAFAFISVFTAAYILIKFFSLRDERVGSVQPDSTTASPTPGPIGHAPETRQDFVRALERTKAPLLMIYRAVMHIAVALFVIGGIYFFVIATPGNQLFLVSIMMFAVAFVIWAKMSRFMQDEKELSSITFDAKPMNEPKDFSLFGLPLKISETVVEGEPTVIKLETDAIKTASALLRSGNDLDAVCRQINPEYAGWGTLQKQLFRKAMEAMLKAEAASGH